MKPKYFKNRSGVTLLFVVSMIVLFLLMGTAFVVVSTDFLQSRKTISRQNVKTINSAGEHTGQRFLQRALYDLLRGPSLDNINSPLRGHSILADMYGYGMTSYVKNIETNIIEASGAAASNQFFRISLIGSANNIHGNTVTYDDFIPSTDDITNPVDDSFVIANNIFSGKPIFTSMRTEFQQDLADNPNRLPLYDMIPSAPGRLNGQLLTFASGPAAGLTTRIVDHQVFPIVDNNFANGIRYGHRFVVMIVNNQSEIDPSNIEDYVVELDSDINHGAPDGTIPTRVVINGRAFGGSGSGSFNPYTDFNMPAMENSSPNMTGMSLAELISTENYLSRKASTPRLDHDHPNLAGFGANPQQLAGFVDRDNNYAANEPYDAVDRNNWFLAGITVDHDGINPPMVTGAPSFSGPITFDQITMSYMLDDMRDMSAGNFGAVDNSTDDDGDGIPDNLFDSNGDGIPDSIFMDIGLPTFINRDGVRVKPLVAYHVVDLDSKININVHGNRSQIAGNDRFADDLNDITYDQTHGSYLPYFVDRFPSAAEPTRFGSYQRGFTMPGGGFGPSEIFLESFFMDDWTPDGSDPAGVLRKESSRLMIGDVTMPISGANREIRIPGRYGFDPNSRRLRNGGGPVPGSDELVQEAFSQYQLFGYPNTGVRLASTLGGFYQSDPMDIYGRFVKGFPEVLPNNTPLFATSMPIVDVTESLLGNHSEIVSNPYESIFNLTSNRDTSFDAHYTLEELERIYRQGDVDLVGTSLGRLALLAPSLDLSVALTDTNPLNNFNYQHFTTDSWEVPTLYQEFVQGECFPDSSGSLTGLSMGDISDGMQTLLGKLHAILSHIDDPGTTDDDNVGIPIAAPGDAAAWVDRERLIAANITGYAHDLTGSNPVDDRTFTVDPAFRKLLSSEILAGRPFDINRPFGDGFDTDNDGIIDELDDTAGDPDELAHPDGSTTIFDHDGDSQLTVNDIGTQAAPYLNRQQFARQLFVLALLATEFVDRNGNGSFLDDEDFTFDPNQTDDWLDRLQYRRVIAQWAINVVDFRDPDSIRTPFEVDLNPFDGWDVDGDLVNTPPPAPTPDATSMVLWGAERPDVLITETFAMHNRRAQDTTDDPSGDDTTQMNNPDQDFDNLMVPVAAAFFELYHPQFTDEIPAAELDGTNAGGIDLAQADPNGNPIYRLRVVQGTGPAIDNPGNPFNPLLDPEQTLPGQLVTNRFIYFDDLPNLTAINDEMLNPESVFVSDLSNVNDTVLAPGEFAVLGSAGVNFNGANTTFLGRRNGVVFDETGVPTEDQLELDETRRIEMDPAGRTVRVYDSAGNLSPAIAPTNITVIPFHGPVSLPNGSRRSAGLSDPYLGYAGIFETQDDMNPMEVVDGPDGPYFELAGNPATADTIADQQARLNGNTFAGHVGGPSLGNGLYNSQFVVLFQRLADPTRPFNRFSNPYLTMDSSATDLFVFNGLSSDIEESMINLMAGPTHFGSFERRGNADPQETVHGQADSTPPNGIRFRELWKTDFKGLGLESMDGGEESMYVADPGSHVFPLDFLHSLGQMNLAYGNEDARIDPAFPPSGSVFNNGMSNSPFASLTWNNRPYNNAYELTLVPFGSTYFMTSQFDVSLARAGLVPSPYNSHITTPAYMTHRNAIRGTPVSGDFPHLLNFHNDGTGAMPQTSPLLHRIIDVVEVPSPYVGTKSYLNPDSFEGTGGATQLTRNFAPPFDYVSSFRYPGKININTISDFRTWNAIHGSYAWSDFQFLNPDSDEVLDDHFIAYQRGSFRPNPFKPHSALNQVADGAAIPASQPGLFRRRTAGATDAIFDYDPNFNTPPGDFPLHFEDRNADFKYHPRNRIGNLVTNRSSVFAIWVSIRYFEVESQDNNNGAVEDMIKDEPYMDQDGRIETSRAFFIVDRSIPVAFEPGKDHNVERAIRVSTYIENEELEN